MNSLYRKEGTLVHVSDDHVDAWCTPNPERRQNRYQAKLHSYMKMSLKYIVRLYYEMSSHALIFHAVRELLKFGNFGEHLFDS